MKINLSFIILLVSSLWMIDPNPNSPEEIWLCNEWWSQVPGYPISYTDPKPHKIICECEEGKTNSSDYAETKTCSILEFIIDVLVPSYHDNPSKEWDIFINDMVDGLSFEDRITSQEYSQSQMKEHEKSQMKEHEK